MQVTIDTRHDTLEEALAVIRMAFARTKDLAAAQGTAEATGAAPRRTPGSASQADADTGIAAAAVDDAASRRARATARKAPTKRAVAKKAATEKTPTKKGSAKKAPAKKAASKKAAAAGSATKRAPASMSAGSRHDTASNIAPPGRADVVRAWARDQGMQVKAAGRMPAAVIAAYDQAHS